MRPALLLRRRALLALTPSLLLPGCTLLPAADPAPMRQLYDDNACPATQAPVLLVLLPGRYMALEELQQQGFVQAVRSRGIAADVLLVDADIRYARDGSIGQRMQLEVLDAAQRWGYRRIWLAGISLGGFVALATAMQHPARIEGVVALAPYLGRDTLQQAIAAAGGASAWSAAGAPDPDGPDASAADGGGIDTRLWRWLAQRPATDHAPAPQLWLGFGSDDRLVAGHRLLAPLLPPGHVQAVPGGHTWAPWRQLWAQWLDQPVLPRSCQVAAQG